MLNKFSEDQIKILYLLGSVIHLCVVAFLGEYDVEDGVRATACLIHVGGSHSPAQRQWILITLYSSDFSQEDVGLSII